MYDYDPTIVMSVKPGTCEPVVYSPDELRQRSRNDERLRAVLRFFMNVIGIIFVVPFLYVFFEVMWRWYAAALCLLVVIGAGHAFLWIIEWAARLVTSLRSSS